MTVIRKSRGFCRPCPPGHRPTHQSEGSPPQRWAVAGALALALLAGSCAGSKSSAEAPGGDPEAQSLAEYDIARDLWIGKNQPRQALEHALRAVELDEENAEAAHLVGLLYLDFCRRNPAECRLPEAERFVRLALSAKPDFREAKNTLGVILIHAKRYDDAIEVLEPLSEDILYRTPENAWGNLGWAYLEKGNYDQAIDALRRSVAAEPRFCVGHYRLALAYEKKRDPRAAVQAYSRAVETEDPACQGLQEAWAGRARALLELDQPENARRDLERCVQLDKSTDAGRQCGALLGKLQ